jgi:IstB-like ATP binding protein
VGPLRPAPLHQDLQTVLRCHIAAFAALGGVPEEVLYDRIKTAVIGEATEGRIVYHRTLLDFAGHYRFHPKACRPYRAKTKGKVEQPFRYVRQDFFLGRTGGRGAHARRRGWPQRLLLHTWRHYRFARQSQGQGCLRERSRWLARSALLIVDEIGYLPVTPGGGNLVFQLVNARYEKGAMILTSNRGFAE